MTGCQTERVSVPKCHIAAGVLLQIATPLFKASLGPDGQAIPGNEEFEAWYTIRTSAQRMQDRGSMRLSAHEDLQLMAALKIAHEATCVAVLTTKHCGCQTSRDVRELLALLETIPAAEAARL